MNFLRQSVLALCQAVIHLLRRWTKPNNDALVLNAALDLTRSKTELMLENALLRQQLIVLRRQTKRPKLTWCDRALFVVLASKLRTWKQSLLIARPDTVLRWHRELFRRIWTRKSKSESKPGRPPLAAAGIEVLRTPYRAPKANAICERFLGSLRRECLDHILILGQGHLYHTVKEYVRYFNLARPHQGIAQSIPCPPESLPHRGKIVSYPILGGLHHDYRRQAA